MSTNKNNKKILILGIILLVLAGIIVVALKGFDVSLMFGKHESIEIKLDSKIDLNIIEEVCSEIFTDKEYVVKELEVFGDSAQINVEVLNDDEKINLVNKINEKFGTSKTVDDLKISNISNKRIRDIAKPYAVPMVCSFALVFIYMAIRFRKINSLKIIIGFIGKVLLCEAILLSIIAIARMPTNGLVVNFLVIIAVAQLIGVLANSERKLNKYNLEQK